MTSAFITSIIFTSILLIVMGVLFLYQKKHLDYSEKKAVRLFYFRKVAFVLMIWFGTYFWLSIPYFSEVYKSGSIVKETNYNSEKFEVKNYVVDNNRRIEKLEKDLVETKEELRAFRDHYRELVQWLVFILVIFGGIQIYLIKKKIG